MIIGGVVPVVNVKGVQGGQMVLDGATIAAIYLGDITKWNDARIKKLNPDLALPATAIAPIYRSDGSGTNFLFSNYLSKHLAEVQGHHRREHLGAVAGGHRRQGQRGCCQHDGADRRGDRLRRVRLRQAEQDGLHGPDQLRRQEGRAGCGLVPGRGANADWAHAPGYYLILTNQPGEKSWPITGASFILVYSVPPDPAATAAALKFFDWAYRNGGKMAAELDYVPLPESLVGQIRATWKAQIKGVAAM